jgi:hypothetical protein
VTSPNGASGRERFDRSRHHVEKTHVLRHV